MPRSKIKRGIILAFWISFSITKFFAQGSDTKKNHLSVDPFLPVFGTYQVQYERALGASSTIGLSLGLKTSSGIFEVSGIDVNRISTKDFNFNGIKLLPEFRWYIQKPESGYFGFYAGAYAKYQNFKDDISGIYEDSNQQDIDILINAKIRTLGFGLEVGYKLPIRKRFYIDFLIAGPGISFNEISLDEIEPVPEEFYDDLSDALAEYGFFEWLNPDFRINGNQDTNITLPSFRYGVKLGYTF
ncbi:DUF3575 domain-containing protein [Flagellimonas sp. S3867]|uniref:DUF3575 domain-containing protein n=1 Tax=Flagellimonas sp. S3867 TaxID=2768063 RepID=UPI00168480F0|nr:DUF3575 domain-containing protein [Flagellimonas sp. S3867]